MPVVVVGREGTRPLLRVTVSDQGHRNASVGVLQRQIGEGGVRGLVVAVVGPLGDPQNGDAHLLSELRLLALLAPQDSAVARRSRGEGLVTVHHPGGDGVTVHLPAGSVPRDELAVVLQVEEERVVSGRLEARAFQLHALGGGALDVGYAVDPVVPEVLDGVRHGVHAEVEEVLPGVDRVVRGVLVDSVAVYGSHVRPSTNSLLR